MTFSELPNSAQFPTAMYESFWVLPLSHKDKKMTSEPLKKVSILLCRLDNAKGNISCFKHAQEVVYADSGFKIPTTDETECCN